MSIMEKYLIFINIIIFFDCSVFTWGPCADHVPTLCVVCAWTLAMSTRGRRQGPCAWTSKICFTNVHFWWCPRVDIFKVHTWTTLSSRALGLKRVVILRCWTEKFSRKFAPGYFSYFIFLAHGYWHSFLMMASSFCGQKLFKGKKNQSWLPR